MIKIRKNIYFRKGYNVDAVDEIVEKFHEAEQWYADNCVRFYGHPERLQELIRAIRTVEDDIEVK